ncbi:hypothetical protein E6Q11_01120 [Candidatus Dojkabacteria bacterium]|uniref:Uncharacterized protein n=1 Tax=Candidatus Dojkabacteria bacterium TaxID=2099670 RepID=A0A5C7JAY6_9BACT|nr:MAG: hypothetical protein E6Q11_01120 [Candidatus Dojkabacteria bacterium]
MAFYLESLDGNQSYRADLFTARRDLIHGEVYSIDDLEFQDWLRTSSQHKSPPKKLRAVNYAV